MAPLDRPPLRLTVTRSVAVPAADLYRFLADPASNRANPLVVGIEDVTFDDAGRYACTLRYTERSGIVSGRATTVVAEPARRLVVDLVTTRTRPAGAWRSTTETRFEDRLEGGSVVTMVVEGEVPARSRLGRAVTARWVRRMMARAIEAAAVDVATRRRLADGYVSDPPSSPSSGSAGR